MAKRPAGGGGARRVRKGGRGGGGAAGARAAAVRAATGVIDVTSGQERMGAPGKGGRKAK